MNKVKLVATLFIGVIGSLTVWDSGSSDQHNQVPQLFTSQLGAPTPRVTYTDSLTEEQKRKIPNEAKLYRFVNKNVSEDDFKLLAKKFNIDAVPKHEKNRILAIDDSYSLWVDQETGKWSFSDESKIFKKSGAGKVPSDEAAANLAKQYLETNGWLPTDFKLSGVSHFTESSSADHSEIIGKSVYFYRHINNNAVYGVSRIIVDINDAGEICGVSKFFRDIEEAGNTKLKTVEKAIKELKDGKATLTTDNTAIKEAAIQDVKLRYWEDPGSNADQPYMQPVYVFKAKSNSHGKEEDFEGILPAIEGSEFQINPKLTDSVIVK